MNKEKDKDLDDLFKKRLEDPVDPVGYDEKDWDAMEQMLGKPKRSGIIYWLPILSGVAAMLLLFLGWWVFTSKTKDVISKNQLHAINHNPHAKTDTLNNKVQQPANQNKMVITPNFAITHGIVKPHTDNKYKGYLKNQGAVNQPIPALANVAGHHKAIVSTGTNVSNGATGVNNTDTGNVPERQNIQLLAALSSTADMKNEIIAAQPINSTEIPKAAYRRVASENNKGKIIDAAKPGFRPRYALSVLAAPDINGVGSFQQSKVGTNVGLLFSAGVTKKFTISTGALYSVKPYEAALGDFHLPYQFATNPENVMANCQMLDIPLNIGYQLYNKHQNKLSVGTGLSSYIMLHEDYRFNYANASVAGPAYFDVPHSSGYFFGVVNLNATYEHQINSKVGISVQPYLKLPLTNIGYSQVRLQTTGVAVGLNWNLN
jgi:hypothetical protein